MLLLALICIALTVVLPQLLRHGWRRGMLALLGVGVVAALGLGTFLVLVWLIENVGWKGGGWGDRILRSSGHLLRFILFGLMGAILWAALVGGHHLGTAREGIISAVSGLAGGVGGCLFHRILGPEPWSVSAGILLPLFSFVLLAVLGRIAPPQSREDSPPS